MTSQYMAIFILFMKNLNHYMCLIIIRHKLRFNLAKGLKALDLTVGVNTTVDMMDRVNNIQDRL